LAALRLFSFGWGGWDHFSFRREFTLWVAGVLAMSGRRFQSMVNREAKMNARDCVDSNTPAIKEVKIKEVKLRAGERSSPGML
jgi:hypothetical protein